MAPPIVGKRSIVLVLECYAGGMGGEWSVSVVRREGAPAEPAARGRWVREGRERDAPIAILAELSDPVAGVARLVRGRNGDGEQVLTEVVQSLAFELF